MNRVTYLRKFVTFLVFVSAFCSHAQATNLTVNCDGMGALSTINGALNLLNPQGPNTVTVSGACHENIVIESFDRLTLIARPGASITDASSGNAEVILILDSQRVTIQGFTVNGGLTGILCFNHSLCRFSGNTVQGSAGHGVVVGHSSSAGFFGDIIQNNPNGRGIDIEPAGEVFINGVTISGNGTAIGEPGIHVLEGSFLQALNSTVKGNGAEGIRVSVNSTLRAARNTITGNAGDGIRLSEGSVARFQSANVITGNAGHGVSLNDLSFANFLLPDNNVSGNSVQPDVVCNPQFSATRGTKTNIGGGTTNCIEP